MRIVSVLLIGLFQFVGVALADIHVELNVTPQKGTVNDIYSLEVTIRGEEAEQVGAPVFSKDSSFQVHKIGTSSNVSIVNFEKNVSVTYSFQIDAARSLTPGKYPLPQGYVEVAGEKLPLKRPVIEIVDKAVRTKEPQELDFTQIVSKTSPYVGEQIQYRTEVLATERFAKGEVGDVEINGFWRESFGQYHEQWRQAPGGAGRIYTLLEALYPMKPGSLTIPERIITASISRRSSQGSSRIDEAWADLIGSSVFNVEQKRFAAAPVELNVRPLPKPEKPHSGYIPVGRVELMDSLDKTLIREGETISLTLVITSDANLKPYELGEPIGEHSSHFTHYVDSPKLLAVVRKSKVIMEKTFTIAFVPKEAGTWKLPQFEIVSFNPQKEQYESALTKAHTVSVIEDATSNTLHVVTKPSVQVQQDEVPVQAEPKTPLGSDLHPQRMSHEAASNSFALPNILSILWIILIPLVAIGFRAGGTVKKQLKNPRKKQQSKAIAQAIADINAISIQQGNREKADMLSSIIKKYLQTTIVDANETLATGKLKTILQNAFPDSKVAESVESFLLSLEPFQFGSARLESGKFEEMTETLKSLILEIEKLREK